MTQTYYTTDEVMQIFKWKSKTTVQRKQQSGFLPEPDLRGSPNKWLKRNIDAIIDQNDSTQAAAK